MNVHEVAELIDVSPRWYVAFELGTDRRFSCPFVERVASALCLNESDRAQLFRLALPEVAAAADYVERSVREGALHASAQIRALSRRLGAASSFEETTTAALETLQALVVPDCITVANIEREDGMADAFAVGPRASFAESVMARTVLDMNPQARSGAIVMCENAPAPTQHLHQCRHPVRVRLNGVDYAGVHDPDLDGYCEFNSHLGERSGITVGLFERGVYRGNLVAFWSEPRAHSASDVDAFETVRALLELAAAQPAR